MKKLLLMLCIYLSISQLCINQIYAQTASITTNGPTSFCVGGNVILHSNVSTGNRWYKNGTAISGAVYQNYTATQTGAYTLRISGVATLDTIRVTAYSLPTASITPAGTSGTVSICAGSSVTLTSSNAGIGGSYLWSNGATTQSITVSTAGSFSVKVTNANGCFKTSPVKNTVIAPLPSSLSISATGPTSFCAGGSVTLESSVAAAGLSYQWYKGTTKIIGATNQTYNATTAGSYTVRSYNGTCYSQASNAIAVTLYSLPSATITPAGTLDLITICEGSSVTLSVPSAGTGASYLWNTGATSRTITTSIAGSFSVTVTNANGCTRTSVTKNTIVVPIPEALNISAQGNTSFCSGLSVTLQSSLAPEGLSYQWYKGATKIVGATSQTYNATSAGNYTVRSYNGTCYSDPSNIIPVTVYALPVANISPAGTVNICKGSSITLTASSAGTGGSYAWSNGAITRPITVSETGSYAVTLTNSRGCSKTSLATIVNVLPPTPIITANGPTTFCEGDSVTLSSSLASAYLWSNGATSQSITVHESGNYSVTVTDNSGCSNVSDLTAVTVNHVTVDLGTDLNLYIGYGPTSLSLSSNMEGVEPFTYEWSTGASTAGIVVAPSQSTNYNLTVKDNNGCVGSDSIRVNVIDVRCGKDNDKVLVCHTDQLGYTHNICVDNSAVPEHLSHNDYLGDCISNSRTSYPGESLNQTTSPGLNSSISVAPNPFFEQATLSYTINTDSNLKIEMYNVLGEKVTSIFEGKQTKGNHTSLIDLDESKMPNGIYFIKLFNGNELKVIRIVKEK